MPHAVNIRVFVCAVRVIVVCGREAIVITAVVVFAEEDQEERGQRGNTGGDDPGRDFDAGPELREGRCPG